MRKFVRDTKNITVNLFADFILSKIDKKDKTIIEVTDCGPFFLVNGVTSSNEILDLTEIQNEFCKWFDDHLTIYENKTFNIIDVIKYGQEISDNKFLKLHVHKDVYLKNDEFENFLSVRSEFPFGYSLDCGRSINYYYHYILNQISSTIGVKEMKIKLKEINEELDIEVECDSIYSNSTIKNLILDVFDFDLPEFNKRFDNFEFYEDVLFQNFEKPYLVQDRLKDIIIF